MLNSVRRVVETKPNSFNYNALFCKSQRKVLQEFPTKFDFFQQRQKNLIFYAQFIDHFELFRSKKNTSGFSMAFSIIFEFKFDAD